MATAKDLSFIIRDSFRKSLVYHSKYASGTTYKSIEVKIKRKSNFISADVYAGFGFQHIQWGKRANTKMPVYKDGNRFRLVPELERWKQALGLTIPDFLLARSIAKKARPGIDLIGKAEEIMLPRLSDVLRDVIGMEEYLLRGFNNLPNLQSEFL